jgi:transposase
MARSFSRRRSGGAEDAQPDAREEEVMRLKAKIGDLTMENELLYAEARRLKQNLPLASRGSRT